MPILVLMTHIMLKLDDNSLENTNHYIGITDNELEAVSRKPNLKALDVTNEISPLQKFAGDVRINH